MATTVAYDTVLFLFKAAFDDTVLSVHYNNKTWNGVL
jgi:hypothetical protein